MKKIQVKYSKWSKELEEKVQSNKFEKGVALATFNGVIARGVAQTSGSIVETQLNMQKVNITGYMTLISILFFS